jgi:hypothetical protein
MSKLSGLKDVDREIFSKVDDKELLIACSIDKYTWNTVCDDNFLKRRILQKYPQIEQYKGKDETWKHFFLRAIYYIAKMKEDFEYEYTFGDFEKQYNLLKIYNKEQENKDNLLRESSNKGELALVIWGLKNGANIHANNDIALRWTSGNGHLEVVKYLVKQGADIHSNYNYALKSASLNGHLEVVKYLVKKGADIHAINDLDLRWASSNEHMEVVKYLVENGADIHAINA